MSYFPKFKAIYLTKEKLSLEEKIDFKKYSGLKRACIFVSRRRMKKANERIFLITEWNSSDDYEARGIFFEDNLDLNKPIWCGLVSEERIPKEKYWKKITISGVSFLITTIISTSLLFYTQFNVLFANPQTYSEATIDSSDDLNFTKGGKISSRLKIVNTSEHSVLKINLIEVQLLPINSKRNSIKLNFDKDKKITFVGIRNEKTIDLKFHKPKTPITPGKYKLLIDMEVRAGLIWPNLRKQIGKEVSVWEKNGWAKKADTVTVNLCSVSVIFETGVNFKNGISAAAILTGYKDIKFLSVGGKKIKGSGIIDNLETTCRIEWQTQTLIKYQKYLFLIAMEKNDKSFDCNTLTEAIDLKFSRIE